MTKNGNNATNISEVSQQSSSIVRITSGVLQGSMLGSVQAWGTYTSPLGDMISSHGVSSVCWRPSFRYRPVKCQISVLADRLYNGCGTLVGYRLNWLQLNADNSEVIHCGWYSTPASSMQHHQSGIKTFVDLQNNSYGQRTAEASSSHLNSTALDCRLALGCARCGSEIRMWVRNTDPAVNLLSGNIRIQWIFQYADQPESGITRPIVFILCLAMLIYVMLKLLCGNK